MPTPDQNRQQVLGLLTARGIASSNEIQAATGLSQPSASRLLSALSSRIVELGRARTTLYGMPKSIHGMPAQQPLSWTAEDGVTRRVGTLSFLARDVVHVESELVASITVGALPWYLKPLQAQGFLGRLLAQRLSSVHAVGDNPETWGVESALFAALHLQDGSGAMSVGESADPARHPPLPADAAGCGAALDALSQDVARTLPAGSSAGGEQPKFLALDAGGEHLVVKFSPPAGTPFGRRWHDLLHAEALAIAVLARHGVPVAHCRIVQTSVRTYLLSERFDRIGARGRRHVVAVGAVHDAFVSTGYANWAASCESLAAQRRLSRNDAERARALLQFGRLIGNTDMHSGNLGLLVEPEDLRRGRFTLAPVYDMLPMRWRPSQSLEGVVPYAPFEPDALSAAGPAAAPAREFWSALSGLAAVSRDMRAVAAGMASRLDATAG